ncbi:MAG: hypothetical protein AB8G15_04695 [Saprospiraceae bacterium]
MKKSPADDPHEEFDINTRTVTIKYFYFESEARLYAARLTDAGIKCFVSNANTGTVIPVGEGSIGLHVRSEDSKLARQIVAQLDVKAQTTITNENFRDADKDDIAYERQLHEQSKAGVNYIVLFLLAIIASLLLFYYLNAQAF